MANKSEIRSGKIFVQDIFKMWFRIPEYQRPYVWTNDQLSELLEDISHASINAPDSEYFLGSIVFQRKEANALENREYDENDLLDGQQRLTTLLLLNAVARDLTADSQLKGICQENIFQKGNEYTNKPEIVRILFKIRHEVEDFVNVFVKSDGGTLKFDELKQLGEESKDTSIRNMSNAILKFHAYFTKEHKVSIENFFKFLLTKVLLVYVASEELEDAFRLFTILNDRGIRLRNSDILKALNLRALDNTDHQIRWGKFWEELEGELGEEFDRFMSWIRTILVKEKARLSLLKEFEDNIYNPKEAGVPIKPLLTKGIETFRLIEIYHNHYTQLLSGNNYHINNTWEFDNLIAVMNAGLPSTDWVPPLLAYYNKFKEKGLLNFLKKLDNKFSSEWISQYTPTERIESMNEIIRVIESSADSQFVLDNKIFSIDEEGLLRNIEGKVYGRMFARYVLLKLDYLLIDSKTNKLSEFIDASIEHILPQNPDENSQWTTDFSEEDRVRLTHSIGNLILLGRRKNSSMGRLDFELKKQKYFSEHINIFPNSVRIVGKYAEWKPSHLQENHTSIIERFKKHYLN